MKDVLCKSIMLLHKALSIMLLHKRSGLGDLVSKCETSGGVVPSEESYNPSRAALSSNFRTY